MQNITDRIEYLKKHVKYIHNNPGLVWCLDYGIDALDKALLDIKNVQDKYSSHVISFLQDSKRDLILRFNKIIEGKDLEIEKLKKIIKVDSESEIVKRLHLIIETQRNKILDIQNSWTDRVRQNHETYKLLITKLEEKVQRLVLETSTCKINVLPV